MTPEVRLKIDLASVGSLDSEPAQVSVVSAVMVEVYVVARYADGAEEVTALAGRVGRAYDVEVALR